MRWIKKILCNIESKEELNEIFERAAKNGVISNHLHSIISRLIDISDKQVEEVMIPRVDMVTVKVDMSLEEAIEVYKKHGFSKMPVIKERADNVLGILHMKEVLKHLDKMDKYLVRDLMVRPVFIPENKKVLDSLRFFQARHISIAMVVDEFGSVTGLVTLEDLIEEIVGEIWEEFDKEEVLFRKQDDGSIIFKARIDLDSASKILGVNLESEEVNTLGGYILEKLDRVPKNGEKFTIHNIQFEIINATQQRLKEIKARVIKGGDHE